MKLIASKAGLATMSISYKIWKRARNRQNPRIQGGGKFERRSFYVNIGATSLILVITLAQVYIAWKQKEVSDIMSEIELSRIHPEFEVTPHQSFPLTSDAGRSHLELPLLIEIYPKKDVRKLIGMSAGAALFLSDREQADVCAIGIRGIYGGVGQRTVRLVKKSADELKSLISKFEKNGLLVEQVDFEILVHYKDLLDNYSLRALDEKGRDLEMSSFHPDITPLYVAAWSGGTGYYFEDDYNNPIEKTCPQYATKIRQSVEAFELRYGDRYSDDLSGKSLPQTKLEIAPPN